MTETIEIKYFTDKIEKLTYIDGKSDWIDLRAAEDVSLKQGEFRLIPLGVAMKLPKGYEAHIVPRSSTFKNFGIIQTNHMGIIDESYCGGNDQWYFPAYALRDTKIRVNDRICQFRIMEHQPQVVFDEVDELEGQDRGGLGSTGIGAVLGKVRCLLAAVCVVSVLGTAGCGGSQKEREEIRLLGIEQLDGGNYEEAIQSFEQALALSSKVVGEFELDILKYRAEAEYRAGDYQAAAYTYQVLMQVDEEREEYRELLKILDLGLEDRLTSKVGLLSGGQRQALTLLMAALRKPDLLLLDEHTAALDPKTAAKVLDATERIVQKDHLTTLMITHNMKDAIVHGNRLIMMYEGRVALDIAGEDKKKLTVEDLLARFGQATGSDEADDKLLLG